jgi:hypothetical protein
VENRHQTESRVSGPKPLMGALACFCRNCAGLMQGKYIRVVRVMRVIRNVRASFDSYIFDSFEQLKM